MSHFDNLQRMPDDPILQLPILFKAETNPNKVNLGIGSYKDHNGKPLVLSCVRKAEKLLLEKNLDKEYLPIEGNAEFISSTLKFVFGKTLEQINPKCLFAMQTVGGTGALRVCSQFLANIGLPIMYLPDPTWPNHMLIFNRAGMKLNTYPYYDSQTHSLNFKNLCQEIQKIPPSSIIVLHASCHNPSGIDPTHAQWQELSELIKKHQLIPFFDLAYQGFGQGIDEDAYPVRYFLEQKHEMFVASSYSKNLGLYGERVGMLAAFTENPETTGCIASHLKQTVRAMFSMPPLQGGRIAAMIQQSPELRDEWYRELAGMRNRIQEMRKALLANLKAHGVTMDLSFVEKQLGIFSFIGLNTAQVNKLREEYGIYLPQNGRLNIAGLNQNNIDYVTTAIASILKQ